ncbi:MAG: FAD-binding oxidoreductase [Candidatus Obscuribacterales bacterium]|nr:FAD-binding oxidoreductase [Candidatus Obscuribacterales bacterium]
MQNIEQSCYWLATRPDQGEITVLQGKLDADIVVVGAGFTGLWTAYFLKQIDPSRDVVVVEQGVTGYGGSGRNAGIVSACVDHSHALAIVHFGKAEAARLAEIGQKNIDELAQFAFDCDFEKTGQLQIALTQKHLEDCRENNRVAEELGINSYRFLGRDEVQAELNSPLYLGASLVTGGGIINPIKLVGKIKAEAMKLGVRFFERSPVIEVKGGTVVTKGGSINARKIVLATDSYTHHLFPQLLWRFIPLYDYILVSEVLTGEQLRKIGWQNRQGIVDCRSFFNYYRLTSDNRILWGTSEANYYPPNRVDESCDHSEPHYRSLRESFVRHFPQISELNFSYQWGGPIASTTRLTPFFGTLEGGKVIYALGYTGHGIGTTRIAGKILAHMACSKETDLLSLSMVRKKPFPYPPEPLRSLSVNMVTNSLRQVDKGDDPGILLKMLDLLGIGFSS